MPVGTSMATTGIAREVTSSITCATRPVTVFAQARAVDRIDDDLRAFERLASKGSMASSQRLAISLGSRLRSSFRAWSDSRT